MIRGRIQGRKVDMLKDSDILGSNCKSLGYKSSGERVPLVITTLPKRLKRGAIAREESKHASWITGSLAPGMEDPFGSVIMANRAIPSEYVERSVAFKYCEKVM